MDKIETGGPAFPVIPPLNQDGFSANGYPFPEARMSLRDYFAAQVMDRMISLSMDGDGAWSTENVAAGCYNLADAMLQARSREGNGNG